MVCILCVYCVYVCARVLCVCVNVCMVCILCPPIVFVFVLFSVCVFSPITNITYPFVLFLPASIPLL